MYTLLFFLVKNNCINLRDIIYALNEYPHEPYECGKVKRLKAKVNPPNRCH